MKHKPYQKYKSSGIDWIGDIPEGWKIAKLKWFISIKSGDGIETEKIDVEGAYPVYGGNGIMGYTNNFNRYGNDMIIGRVGAKCGNVHLVEGKKWISDNALFLYNAKGFELQYLSLILRVLNLNQYANQNAQPLITGWIVRQQIVTLPSIKEQKSISDFLDKKSAQIDDLIQKKEEMIKLLKEKRAAIINQAVTKGLDPNAKMKPSGIDWIGDIPEGWKIERLKYWVDLINEPEESEDEKFLVDLDNIESFTGKLLNEIEGGGKGMKMFASGDVLLNKLRPYLAKVFYGGKYGCCGGELLVLRPKDKIVPKFLFYRVLSIDFINLINNSSYGVKMPRANWDYIGNVFLPYSNKQEQQAIVRYLDRKTEEIDSLIKKIEAAIAKLREYRSSLITAAVTGKIDVRGK